MSINNILPHHTSLHSPREHGLPDQLDSIDRFVAPDFEPINQTTERLPNTGIIPFLINNFEFGKEAAQIFCLERATIAKGQGTSEDEKFVAEPTRLNSKLFMRNGINSSLFQNSLIGRHINRDKIECINFLIKVKYVY